MKAAKKLAWASFVAVMLLLPSVGSTSASTPVAFQTATTSHATKGATCGNTTTPTDRLANAQTMTPSEVLSLPGGGQDYVYYVQGYKTEYFVPPVGFNPLNATDAQLKEYGFQPRPTGDLFQLKQWEEEMSHWKETPVPKVLVLPKSAQRYHKNHSASFASTSIYSTYYNYNWSGYWNKVSTNTFVGIQGNFVQPTPASTVCYTADESAWVGFGGSSTSKGLIQAGTDMNYGNTPIAFYEWVGPNGTGVPEQTLPQVNVRPGDSMHVYVSYQTSTGVTNFYVADNTNGTSQSISVTLDSSFYDGTTAEWVDEAPATSNGVMSLLNYQNNPWTNAQSYNTAGVWNSITAYTYEPMDITDTGGSTGTIESAASTLTTSTSFTDYWHSCN